MNGTDIEGNELDHAVEVVACPTAREASHQHNRRRSSLRVVRRISYVYEDPYMAFDEENVSDDETQLAVTATAVP